MSIKVKAALLTGAFFGVLLVIQAIISTFKVLTQIAVGVTLIGIVVVAVTKTWEAFKVVLEDQESNDGTESD